MRPNNPTRRLPVFLLGGWLAVLSPHYTLQAAELPPGADAGRQLIEPGKRPSLPTEIRKPQILMPEEEAVPQTAAGADELRFLLGGVKLEGVTLLTSKETDALVQPLLGKEVSLNRLSELARELTALYRSKGYLLAQVSLPPQRIGREGEVHLQAMEGVIESIDIEGGDPRGESLIRAYLEPLLNDRSVTIGRIERALLLSGDLEGVAVNARLAAGSGNGRVKMAVKVQRDNVSGQLYYDNMSSPYQGRDRVMLTGQVNNLFGHSDYTRVSLQKPFDTSEMTSWAIMQGIMLGNNGARLELSYSNSETHPGDDLRPFHLEGKAQLSSAMVLLPLQRGRYYNLRTQFGAQYLDSKQTAFNGDFDLYHDRIAMLAGGGSVDWQDNWLGGGLSILLMNYTQGISDDPSLPSRKNAKGEFGKVDFFFNRFQVVSDKVSLQLAAGGQYSSAPLVSSEQYGLGAYPFGRGFETSTITGDQALAGKVELRYDLSKAIGSHISPLISQLSTFVFYDSGKLWNYYGAPASLSSNGFGLRGVLDAHPTRNIDKRSLDFEVFVAWKQHAPSYIDDTSPVVRGRVILNF